MLWENLKIGLRRSAFRGLLLLVLFFSVSLCSFSEDDPLTVEEVKVMTREQLEQAVLTYDESYTLILNVLNENEQGLVQREIALNERVKALEMREEEIILSEISLEIRERALEKMEEKIKDEFWRGFWIGYSTGRGQAIIEEAGILIYDNFIK